MQLLDKTVEMRGSQILNMRSYEEVMCRRRLIAATTILACIAIIPLIIALCTVNWNIINFTNLDHGQVEVELGMVGEKRTVRRGKEVTTDWIPHFPEPPPDIARLAGSEIRHFHRAQAALGLISIVLLFATDALAIYTFCHHRYVYKRLAGALYLVTAVCIIATVEVVSQSVDEWKTEVVQKAENEDYEFDAKMSLGYSSKLAYAVAAVCALACLSFFYASHKQKGDNAATTDLEIEDRPIHMGR